MRKLIERVINQKGHVFSIGKHPTNKLDHYRFLMTPMH